ncbi:ATP-binding protein [Psychromonas sp. SP041]|uniref:AAA family ATPase n=1 Tax=Psychromonas sp. SP041 TaxID=1365007 RepID=UPI00042A6888|nr:ATP-binding protein [Psychromonas sp. SP041]
MIKKFGFKNFSSFKEGAEISFEYDGNTPVSVSNGELLGTVLGIKGSNGSGKTNVLKALSFLFYFVNKRMTTKQENKKGDADEVSLPIDSFFFSKAPSEFYLEFISNGVLYYYELDVNKHGIIRELFIRNKNEDNSKDVIFLERKYNQITHSLSEYNELKNIKLKEDQSLISLTSDYNFHSAIQDLKNISNMFNLFISNVGSNGMRVNSDSDLTNSKATFYKSNSDALDFIKSVIVSGDDGIKRIEILTSKDSTGKDIDYPVFIHEFNGQEHPLLYADESMGTKVLFNNLSKYWFALKLGGILIFDEFDIHLHSMILPEIIELFVNPKTNPKRTQLIITAHNTEVIDSLGRYRTILVNKDQNESYCYRLDSISMLRNDRPISPLYQKGKIGGVPKSVSGLVSRVTKELSEDTDVEEKL